MSVVASVIVPTHQGAHRLPALLEALAEQDVTGEWEVVVVVDGVLDDTPSILASWQGRLPLVIARHERAEGVAAALKTGFDQACGTYLIRCDDDLQIGPSFVANHVTAHAGRTDRVVLALTRDLFPDTRYAAAYGRAANERALRAYYTQAPAYRWQHLAACFSLHRDAWAASGGFDPDFAYGEDSEFGYRLWRLGFEFVIDPGLEVGHRGPATSVSTRAPRAFVSGASRRLFADRHPEAVRPPAVASGAKVRVWRTMVNLVATTVRTPAGYRRLGSLADLTLRVAPPRPGGRLVALLVESAGLSGQRHGNLDLHSYRGQKDAEARAERNRVSPARGTSGTPPNS